MRYKYAPVNSEGVEVISQPIPSPSQEVGELITVVKIERMT
jgi:hypothetical protein